MARRLFSGGAPMFATPRRRGKRTITNLSKDEVRVVACPRCLAYPGQRCMNDDGQYRVANHLIRVEIANAEFGRDHM